MPLKNATLMRRLAALDKQSRQRRALAGAA